MWLISPYSSFIETKLAWIEIPSIIESVFDWNLASKKLNWPSKMRLIASTEVESSFERLPKFLHNIFLDFTPYYQWLVSKQILLIDHFGTASKLWSNNWQLIGQERGFLKQMIELRQKFYLIFSKFWLVLRLIMLWSDDFKI